MTESIIVEFICTNKWENGADAPCGCEAAWDNKVLTAEAWVYNGELLCWECPVCEDEQNRPL